jgi:hypothetical protein
MANSKRDFSFIIRDNEYAARLALDQQNYVQAFLLVHALIESLLRHFLDWHEEHFTFNTLIKEYEDFLKRERYPHPTFVKELIEFNRRRNRVVHQLWKKGYSFTNRQLKDSAFAAVAIYGLLIEWVEAFDPEIIELGFQYDA